MICEALSGCSIESKLAVDRGGAEDLFRGYCISSSKNWWWLTVGFRFWIYFEIKTSKMCWLTDCNTWEKVWLSRRSRRKLRAVFSQAEEGWGVENWHGTTRCMMPVRHLSDGSGGWLDVWTLGAGEKLGWRYMFGRHSRQSCLKLRWWGHLRGEYRQDTGDIQSNP